MSSFREYLREPHPYYKWGRDLDSPCDLHLNLTDNQDKLARCLHWIRGTKWGLEYCRKNDFYPGPWGNMVKRRWIPHFPECCPVDVPPHIGEKEYDPFIQRKHCQSYYHCRHVVYHHSEFIIERLKPPRLVEIEQALNMPLREIPLILRKAKGFYERMIYKSRLEGTFELPEPRQYHVDKIPDIG